MKWLIHVGIVLSTAALLSCSSGSSNQPGEPSAQATVSADTVRLTKEQQKNARLNFAQAQQQRITQGLKVFGSIHVPPQYAYSITAPLGGIVRSTHVLPGTHVHKGETIITLEHPDFITLQEEYLTASAKLEQAESELTRQQALARDSINARKSLERARAEAASLRIQKKALSEKLALIHIKASALTESNLSRVVSIPAPISGYVTSVTVNNGSYVAPNTPMIELADTDHMHIELSVFERDISLVRPDQVVHVWLTDDPTRERIGHVHLVGREVRDDRTIPIHAHLNTPEPSLIPGTTLQAVIDADPHQGWVVPESSVVRYENKFYVFTGSAQRLVRRQVRCGQPANGYVEIMDNPSWLGTESVLTQGVSAVLGAMVNTDE